MVTAQNETSESRKPLPHLTCENSLRSHPSALRVSQCAPVKSRASAARKPFLYRYFSATRSGKPLLVPDKPSSGEPEPEASVFAKISHPPSLELSRNLRVPDARPRRTARRRRQARCHAPTTPPLRRASRRAASANGGRPRRTTPRFVERGRTPSEGTCGRRRCNASGEPRGDLRAAAVCGTL